MDGTWLTGCGAGQHSVGLNVTSGNQGTNLHGSMTCSGEGAPGYRATAGPLP
jgi:hypothetical protein